MFMGRLELFGLLLALSPVALSSGYLEELKNFHAEPWNELRQEHTVHLSLEEALKSLHQVTKRQSSDGLPHVDGEHMFEDGYRYGRIHYSGDNSDVIFVLTYNLRNNVPYQSNLYRSTNYGHNFTNIDSKLDNNTDFVLYQTFFTSDFNKNLLIFAHATAARIYYTLDEGATFVARNLTPSSLNPRTIVYHPTQHGWMIALNSSRSLYVTSDYGGSWTRVADNIATYQWADPKWDSDIFMIYYTLRDPTNVNLTVNLFTSTQPYTTVQEFDKNLGDHDGFLLLGPYIFAARTDNDARGLYISYNRQPFQKAMIPTPYAHQRYLVAHINELQALVIVEHEGGFFNLYLSDLSGVYFSLSLRDIVVEGRNTVDLELIDGVNGTLIANQYTREDPSVSNSPVRTLITLDNGGFWELILPPDEDVDGNTITCEPPDCSLHFHMDTSDYARLGVYSTDSAPGIIVAHGSIGAQLSNNPDLYISRDGGVTWEETLAGSWGVNVADHGGLMVAARDYHQDSSNELMYSCNEGYSWQNFTFTDTLIKVYGVITEPGQHTTIVSLYGGTVFNFRWTVVTVEFAPIFQRECTDSDYYDWLPWDVRSDTDCILGGSIIIERRKPQVCCRNGRDYDREMNFTICDCNSEDFECDYGYARPGTDLTGPCMRDPAVDLPDPCSDGQTATYNASTGYRKIAGDVCQGGIEDLYKPFEAPCCENSTLPPTPHKPTDETPTTSSSSSSSSSTSSSSSSLTISPTTTTTTFSSSSATTTNPPTSVTSIPSSTTTSSSGSSSSSSSSFSSSPSPSSSSSSSTSPSGTSSPSSSSESGIPKYTVIAVGVVLALVTIAAVAILTFCIVITLKHRSLHHNYIRLATAGEPEIQRYVVQSDRDSSLEPLGNEDSTLDQEDDPPLAL